MQKQDIDITSFDYTELKQQLVLFLQNTGEFDDFDFEGSAINTIVDLLVRNSQYDAFLANMVSNESFIASARIRHNVVAHAEKLSYRTRSTTASVLECNITVVPSSIINLPLTLVLDAGTPFIGSVGGQSYTFTNIDSYVVRLNLTTNVYTANSVKLYQGSLITNTLTHTSNTPLTIPNKNCDTSTLVVVEQSQVNGDVQYKEATSLNQTASTNHIYFLSETNFGLYEIAFGRNVIGEEPVDSSLIQVTYIATETNHANYVTSIVAGSLIGGYGNIQIQVTTPSYGGSEREDIEQIRFLAPKFYQAQDRALSETDYIPLIKSQFPFVRSAISWGGEKNIPPEYGTVFVSIISEDGGLVTNSVKQQMVAYLQDYNVGSITPTITDPERFGIDLSIAFSYDNRLTSMSFSSLGTEVVRVTQAYNDLIFDFNQYYNEAELNRRLMSIKGVTSLDIDKLQFKNIDVLRFENPIYSSNFGNMLQPNSIKMTGFIIDSTGKDHKLYDDGIGEIYTSYINQLEQEVESLVGIVDYTTGNVEFSINMIQDESVVTLYVETVDDNFYVSQNKVVYLNDITTSLLNTNQ
jgi:hypothetical protein